MCRHDTVYRAVDSVDTYVCTAKVLSTVYGAVYICVNTIQCRQHDRVDSTMVSVLLSLVHVCRSICR